ncbi:MAG: hypothetical protein PHX05_00040 [Acidobacteriota bacterium]|nr:hypothetical protein [Acidobacteriota bacterium]
MSAERSQYHGHPTIILKEDPRDHGVCFGVNKARLILKHIEEIKWFVAGEDFRAAESLQRRIDADDARLAAILRGVS